MKDDFNQDTDAQRFLYDLSYANLKEQRATRRWRVFLRLLFLLYLFFLTFVWAFNAPDIGDETLGGEGAHAAVIQIIGAIAPGDDNSADAINAQLRAAFRNDNARGVILQINSPGGSAVESNRIYKEIRRLREKYPEKRLYAVAGDFCASGGYFIAAAADAIYADEASLIGSIGVIFSSFGFVETMNKLGVERRVQTAGDNKNMLDPFAPQDNEAAAAIEGILADIHDVFVAAVKDGRGERLAANPNIYSGAIFSGKDSMRLGLIDGFDDVAAVARDVIGVDEIVYYDDKDILESLLESFPASFAGAWLPGIRAVAQ